MDTVHVKEHPVCCHIDGFSLARMNKLKVEVKQDYFCLRQKRKVLELAGTKILRIKMQHILDIFIHNFYMKKKR